MRFIASRCVVGINETALKSNVRMSMEPLGFHEEASLGYTLGGNHTVGSVGCCSSSATLRAGLVNPHTGRFPGGPTVLRDGPTVLRDGYRFFGCSMFLP